MINVSPQSATELLEIIKYLDEELLNQIPNDFINYLETIKDQTYIFKLNKDIPLFDNKFLNETINNLHYILKIN